MLSDAQFVESDGLVAADDLPLGIFGTASDLTAEDSSSWAVTRAAHLSCEEYMASVMYDAVPALSALVLHSGQQTEDEVVSMCRLGALIDLLQLSSQLARNSERHYGMLSSVFTAEKLVWILRMADPTVRAKCCNLVGNLCR